MEQGQSKDLARNRGTDRPGGHGRSRVSEFRVAEAGQLEGVMAVEGP